MNTLAERYVRLVLAVGAHDADYVDAYYGPPELRDEAERERASLEDIDARAAELERDLLAVTPEDDRLARLRHGYLARQTAALRSRLRILRGEKLSFDEESTAIYDALSPHYDAGHYEALLTTLDEALPGEGAVSERLDAFRERFVVPREKIDEVFQRAIDEGRSRTAAHIALPEEESFTVEYVTGKTWSGYNWYQGSFRSLIQVNVEFPIYIERAVDLACHEGYPGHHVYNVLLEKNLVRDRGWVEFSVYPLFSPQSLIAEGSANYGIEMALPRGERVEFERRELFPLAGLDRGEAERYYHVFELTHRLSYAGNDAARRYLDGEIGADEAVDWLRRYALMPPERARQRIGFFDKYRAYVINYNVGLDMVRRWIEASSESGTQRWAVFRDLLSSPRLPSDLARPQV
jgi:hypothetical protein